MNIENEFFPERNKLMFDKDGGAKATIVDEELDPVSCDFFNDGCVTIDTKELSYVVLSESNLLTLLGMIQMVEERAEEKRMKKARLNPSIYLGTNVK